MLARGAIVCLWPCFHTSLESWTFRRSPLHYLPACQRPHHVMQNPVMTYWSTLWVLHILSRSWRTGWSSILNVRSLQFVLSLPTVWSLVLLERIIVRSFAFREGCLYWKTSSRWTSFPFSLSNCLLLLDLEFLDFSTWASHGQLTKIEWTKELHFSFILFLLLIHLVKLLSNFLFEVPNPLFVYLHIVFHFLDAFVFLVKCLLSLDTDLFHCIMSMLNLTLEDWYLQLMLLLELLDLLFMILLAFY
jgi:hypothetical protein